MTNNPVPNVVVKAHDEPATLGLSRRSGDNARVLQLALHRLTLTQETGACVPAVAVILRLIASNSANTLLLVSSSAS